MRILFIAQYFPPEMGALAARASELARHWTLAGHQVTVLTGFPNYPSGVVPPEYRGKMRRLIHQEQIDGYRVVRTWLAALPNRRSSYRILGYVTFFLSACLTGTFLRQPDVIIASSPPLLVGLAGWWLGLMKRRPFVLEVRDLWPDSITASGVSSQESVMIRGLRALSGFLYRASDHLVVVTPAFKDEIRTGWDIPADEISIVTNGVETDLFSPDGDPSQAKVRWGLGENFVAAYIGNFGWAQRLETVTQAATLLGDRLPDVCFLFAGDGADKDFLAAVAQRNRGTNVRLLPPLPRQDVPALIRAADVCIVPLRNAPVFRTVIPSKMLEFMACGRPVILAVDGQARKLLEQAEAGIFVEPENPQALAEAVERLYRDPLLRDRLGRNGREYVVDHLSRSGTAHDYLRELQHILHERKPNSLQPKP